MTKYAIIGAGWRAEFYLRIAALMPDVFSVSGIYIRNQEKRREFSKKYSVLIVDNLEDLLHTEYDFVVSCVSKESIGDVARMLANRGIAVLTETPVMDANIKGKIQVAEQFHLMPRNQAYKSIIDSGILGEVHQVQLSCCHDYHAASLIRFFLDTKGEMPKKTVLTLPDKVSRYNSRAGYRTPEEIVSEQKVVVLDFGGKSAIYDFDFEQYFSDIRTSRVVIRGTKGEIVDNTCTYLKDGIVHSFQIQRNCFGVEESLDGFSLVNITGNGTVWYNNPFKNARLSDEEIAIASCLKKMKEYCVKGNSFYGVKEASCDYLLI